MIHRIEPHDLGRLMKRLRLDAHQTVECAAYFAKAKPKTVRAIEWGNTQTSLQRVFDLIQFYGCCGKIEVYQPPVVETLADMIDALDELGYRIEI